MTRFFSDCLEPACQTHCLKLKVVGCAVLDRLGGFVFAVYLLLIGCAAFAIVSAFTFAVRLPGHSLKVAAPAQVSRAEAGLRLRERTNNWRPPQAASLVPPAPQMSVGELTKGLEEAEGNSPSMQKPHLVHRARVAGWAQRKSPARDLAFPTRAPTASSFAAYSHRISNSDFGTFFPPAFLKALWNCKGFDDANAIIINCKCFDCMLRSGKRRSSSASAGKENAAKANAAIRPAAACLSLNIGCSFNLLLLNNQLRTRQVQKIELTNL
jgi:hypothetical protein